MTIYVKIKPARICNATQEERGAARMQVYIFPGLVEICEDGGMGILGGVWGYVTQFRGEECGCIVMIFAIPI